MIAKTLLSSLAFAATALAQTSTTCSPLKQANCPPAPALGNKKVNCDFRKGACSGFENAAGTNISYSAQEGALFAIENDKQAPTILSKDYIFFGRIEVELQAAPGQGVVTSVVLESADLDEVDWEWIGSDNTQVQSNYFGKGDTTTYDRGGFHTVASPVSTYHKYAVDWTKERIQWIINGTVVRTLNYADAQGGARYPQTPMQVKLGTWVAGLPSEAPGTVEWAGGMTDFSKAPFDAWYKSIKIVDYAGGDKPATAPVKEYTYSDMSGSWQSVKAVSA